MYELYELINKKHLSKKIALDETYLTDQAKVLINQNRRGISKDKMEIMLYTQQTEVVPPQAF